MSTHESVNFRRRHWLPQAVKYRFRKCFPGRRDPRLWVFSAWEGNRYADNARYLFEYMHHKQKEYRVVWQTNSEKLARQLMDQGYEAQVIGTASSRKTQRLAGVAVYTNGIDDFGRRGDVYGAMLVCVLHGFGFKKIYRQLYHEKRPLRRLLSDWKWDTFSWMARDLTIVPSEYSRQLSCEQFHLHDNARIRIAGQARYDALAGICMFSDALSDAVLLERIAGKRTILYMPTFRPDTEEMRACLQELFSLGRLHRLLEEEDAVLLAKLHYLNRLEVEGTDRILVVNDEEVRDGQKLLGAADILMTDYSSCATDFSLLGKPILLFCPDWKKQKARGGFAAEMETCMQNAAFSVEECVEKLAKTLRDPADGLAQSRAIDAQIHAPGIVPGRCAEKNFQIIREALSAEYPNQRG